MLLDDSDLVHILEHVRIYNYMDAMLARMDGSRKNFVTAKEKKFIFKYLNTIDSVNHPFYAYYHVNDKKELNFLIHDRLGRFLIDVNDRANGYGGVYIDLNLNWIDVSDVTDMSNLFEDGMFDGDISLWDVSNVTDMREMFHESCFDGDISKWDVRNVKIMDQIFAYSHFTGDLQYWQVSERIGMDIFDNTDIPEKNRPAVMRVRDVARKDIKEGFDINDMGHELNDGGYEKRHVEKHSKIYDFVNVYVDLCRRTMGGSSKYVPIARSIAPDDRHKLEAITRDCDEETRELMRSRDFTKLMEIVLIYNYMDDLLSKMNGTEQAFVSPEDEDFIECYI